MTDVLFETPNVCVLCGVPDRVNYLTRLAASRANTGSLVCHRCTHGTETGFVAADAEITRRRALVPSPIPTGGPFKVKVGDHVSALRWQDGPEGTRVTGVVIYVKTPEELAKYKAEARIRLDEEYRGSSEWDVHDVRPSPPPAPTGEAAKAAANNYINEGCVCGKPATMPDPHLPDGDVPMEFCDDCHAKEVERLTAEEKEAKALEDGRVASLMAVKDNDYRSRHKREVLRSMGDNGIDRPCESKYPKLAQSVSACGFGWRVR